MRIEFDTDDFRETDAAMMVALIRADFPHLLASVSTVALTLDAGEIKTAIREAMAEAGLELPEEETDPALAFAGGETIEEEEPLADEDPQSGAHSADASSGAATGAATADVERDADNLPHDPRIHAGTKGKNADGRWKRKKAVSDDLVAQVTGELKALPGFVEPTKATAPAPAKAPASPAGAPSAAAAPAPAPAPTPQSQAEAAALADPTGFDQRPPGTDFASIMRKITKATGDNLLTAEQVQGFVQECGLEKLADLIKNPNVLPTFNAKVDAQMDMAEALKSAEAMGG